MDAPTAHPTIRFNRLLPYWAVLQTDFRQTVRGWVYRLWVLMTVVAAGGSILYKVGLHREAGMVHSASVQTGDLLRGLIAGSLGLVALLAVSSVSAERATVADAVLSRGISRHQYFLAKWHSRLAVVLGTFTVLALTVLLAHHFAFDPDVTVAGA
ncbi:MAG: ABC transporter permease, partial [Fimbriiglobus sp.]